LFYLWPLLLLHVQSNGIAHVQLLQEVRLTQTLTLRAKLKLESIVLNKTVLSEVDNTSGGFIAPCLLTKIIIMEQKQLFVNKYEMRVAECLPAYEKLDVTAKIYSSKSIYEYLRDHIYSKLNPAQEHFIIVALSRNNSIIGIYHLSSGGRASTIVDIPMIAKFLLDTMSSGVILSHNHPSGNTNPSESDLKLTRSIKDAINLFNIDILDHIIACEDDYYSFTDNGKI